MKGFPHETPNPSSVFAIVPAPIPIPVPPTTILTAPAIKGGDVPKIIIASLTLTSPAPEQVDFYCERDGAPLTTFYRQSVLENEIITVHWYDDTPGKDEPVHTIVTTSLGGLGSTLANSRISVFNA